MLKNLYKILIVFFGVFLLATSFLVPVSAASVLSGTVYMNQIEYTSVVSLVRNSNSWSSAFESVDYDNWSDLNARADFSSFIGDRDYVYVQYTTPSTNNRIYNVFSYVLVDSYIEPVSLAGDSIKAFFLTGCSDFEFFSQNAAVTSIRFSLRSYENYTIGKVFAFTDVFSIDSVGSELLGSDVYFQYNVSLPSELRFGHSGYLGNFNKQFVLSIDFLFTPYTLEASLKPFAFGLNLDASFTYRSALSNTVVPEDPDIYVPYFPELDTPYYENPDSGSFDDMINAEGNLLDAGALSPDNIEKGFNAIFGNFTTNFTELAAPVQRVSSILSRIVSRIPYLDFILNASLVLGLLAFFLGLGGSIIGALDKRGNSSKLRPINDPATRGRLHVPKNEQ